MAETLASRRAGGGFLVLPFGVWNGVFVGGFGVQMKMTSCWVLKEQPAARFRGPRRVLRGVFFRWRAHALTHTSSCGGGFAVRGCWWVWCGVGVLVV